MDAVTGRRVRPADGPRHCRPTDYPPHDPPRGGRRWRRGQSMAEYAMLLSLVALLCIAVLLFLGADFSARLSTIGGTL